MKAWKNTPKLYDLNSEMSYGINSDGNIFPRVEVLLARGTGTLHGLEAARTGLSPVGEAVAAIGIALGNEESGLVALPVVRCCDAIEIDLEARRREHDHIGEGRRGKHLADGVVGGAIDLQAIGTRHLQDFRSVEAGGSGFLMDTKVVKRKERSRHLPTVVL